MISTKEARIFACGCRIHCKISICSGRCSSAHPLITIGNLKCKRPFCFMEKDTIQNNNTQCKFLINFCSVIYVVNSLFLMKIIINVWLIVFLLNNTYKLYINKVSWQKYQVFITKTPWYKFNKAEQKFTKTDIVHNNTDYKEYTKSFRIYIRARNYTMTSRKSL